MYTMSGMTVSNGVGYGRAFILRQNNANELNVSRFFSASEEILNYKKASRDFLSKLKSVMSGNVSDRVRDLLSALSSYITNAQNLQAIENEILSGKNAKEAANNVLVPKIMRFCQICNDSELSLCRLNTSLDDISEDEDLYSSGLELRTLMQDFINTIHTNSKVEVNSVNLTEPSVIVAHDLTPANFLALDLQWVKAVVLEQGELQGHLTTVLRDLGIAAIFNVKGAMTINNGEYVVVDTKQANVLVDPPKDTIKALLSQQDFSDFDLVQDNNDSENNQSQIIIAGSMGAISDISHLGHSLVHGLGLLRSEFVFLNYQHEPSVEQMQEVFAQIFAKIPKHAPLSARTFDFAGDKRPLFSVDMDEEGPLRKYGAQVGSSLLKKEIRALLLASSGREINIIFPLITRISEAKALRDLLLEVVKELEQEHLTHGNAHIGLMIETPAAVLSARAFASFGEMFLIGTSSLAEYAAAPRAPEEYFTPALSKMIAIACKAAHDEGVVVGVAGRFALRQELIPFYLALGVTYITTDAHSILKIRKVVQNLEDNGIEPNFDINLYNNVMEISSAYDLQKLLYQDEDRQDK